MRKSLDTELMTRYARYTAQVKSYCEVVGIKYVQPTISQFLTANALTRDRLLGEEPAVEATSSKAPATEQVAKPNKRHGLLSFASYVKEQESKATR